MDYLPKKNKWFRAYHKRCNYPTGNNPCRAIKVSKARIDAVDSRGCARIFYCHVWRFEKAEGLTSCKVG